MNGRRISAIIMTYVALLSAVFFACLAQMTIVRLIGGPFLQPWETVGGLVTCVLLVVWFAVLPIILGWLAVQYWRDASK